VYAFLEVSYNSLLKRKEQLMWLLIKQFSSLTKGVTYGLAALKLSYNYKGGSGAGT
jgi:hypothetical protein